MLHKRSTKASPSNPPAVADTTVPRRPVPVHPTLPTPKSLSVSNTVPRTTHVPIKQSSASTTTSRSAPMQKTSALPRSTSGYSDQRLDALASSRSYALSSPSRMVPQHSRSGPEDVPLIYDYDMDNPHPSYPHTSTQFSPLQAVHVNERGMSSLDEEHDTVLGIALPQKHGADRHQHLPPQLIPELQALSMHYHRTTKHPPPPSVSTVSSPSTRLTESPAPWSASTATTTPVSWPSSSPAIVRSSRIPDRKSKTVPQPTLPRSRLPKLPTLYQDISKSRQLPPHLTAEDPAPMKEKKTKRKPIMESPAPTPPPRKSSTRRTTSRDRSGTSSIDETLSRAGASTTPSLSGVEPSPLANRTRENVDRKRDSLRKPATDDVHASLQQSIGAAPSRPSRSGTIDLGTSRPAVMNEHRAGFSSQHRQLLGSAFEEPMPPNPTPGAIFHNGSETSLPDSSKVQRSPSKLGKLSRLGLFTRRAVTPSSDTDKSPKKLQRRGPSAGTGHEGYGKHARWARKTSNEGSAAPSDSEQSVSSAGRTPLIGSGRKRSVSSSRHNRPSQSDLDDFAASRLKPVVMRGGSQTSIPQMPDMSRTRDLISSPEPTTSRTTSASPLVRNVQSPQIPRLRSPRGRIGTPEQLQDQADHVLTLALRRSQRFRLGQDGFPIPAPILTDDLVAPQQITSHDTTWSSVVPSSGAPSSSGADVYRIDPSLLKHDERKAKRAWWNPFRRRNPGVNNPQPALHREPEMAISIPTGPAPRSIPYYAMMESESDNNTTDHIGEFLSEAVQPSSPRSPVLHESQPERGEMSVERNSVLLPTAPLWPQVTYQPSYEDLRTGDEYLVKQPRLPQVGRIPKVVSRSEREHVPSRRSFSQPFARAATSQSPIPRSPRIFDIPTERPQLEIHTDVLPSRPFPEAVNISAKPASAPARAPLHQRPLAESYAMDVVRMSSKHGSEISASSSSDGMISVLGPPLIPSQQELRLMGQMPRVRIPSMHHGEDEIWREYDDFIDHVMSPSRSPKLRPRANLIREEVPSITLPVVPQRPSSRGKMPVPEPRRAMLDLPLPGTLSAPVPIPSPLMLSGKSAADEIRLRRSRIISALHSSYDPSSPFSMREFLNDYDGQGRDSFGLSDRRSASTAGNGPLVSPTNVAFHEDATKPEHTRREHALLLDTVARSKDPARESELHYASLEVARWLSFGRVLFSPAHEEVHMLPGRNVLVIDGLGNEDWSIYCAVTYETDKAMVYDLKETSTYDVPARESLPRHLPANHRRAEIGSFLERFPFHSAFFSAIVLRFPPAMSEAKMWNIVAECRRTLVPGGHLEIMLLDLDIVNMGVQTRRAVRELKMTMATADPEVSLKPGIDNFQTVLGARGFTGLNRCVVGVPVVGRPSGSTDSSSSSPSSRGSDGRRTSGDPAQAFPPPRGHNFSLNELVADHSEKADAQIGRMVSSCARGWWTHVYEATVIPDGDLSRSIFADKQVLQECKSRASSFKLLIAHAQRPVFESRRRTMSEPGTASLVTSGPTRRPKPPVE